MLQYEHMSRLLIESCIEIYGGYILALYYVE